MGGSREIRVPELSEHQLALLRHLGALAVHDPDRYWAIQGGFGSAHVTKALVRRGLVKEGPISSHDRWRNGARITALGRKVIAAIVKEIGKR